MLSFIPPETVAFWSDFFITFIYLLHQSDGALNNIETVDLIEPTEVSFYFPGWSELKFMLSSSFSVQTDEPGSVQAPINKCALQEPSRAAPQTPPGQSSSPPQNHTLCPASKGLINTPLEKNLLRGSSNIFSMES